MGDLWFEENLEKNIIDYEMACSKQFKRDSDRWEEETRQKTRQKKAKEVYNISAYSLHTHQLTHEILTKEEEYDLVKTYKDTLVEMKLFCFYELNEHFRKELDRAALRVKLSPLNIKYIADGVDKKYADDYVKAWQHHYKQKIQKELKNKKGEDISEEDISEYQKQKKPPIIEITSICFLRGVHELDDLEKRLQMEMPAMPSASPQNENTKNDDIEKCSKHLAISQLKRIHLKTSFYYGVIKKFKEHVAYVVNSPENLASDEQKAYLRGTAAKADKYLEIIDVTHEEIIEKNLKLVSSIAHKYLGGGLSYLDLFQDGFIGLVNGIERFEYVRGYRLSTFVTYHIRQSITKALMDSGHTIIKPTHIWEFYNQITKIKHKYKQKTGVSPSEEKIAEEMVIRIPKRIKNSQQQTIQFKLGKIKLVNQSMEKMYYLDNSFEEENGSLYTIIQDENSPDPQKAVIQKYSDHENNIKIRKILATFSPREEMIFRMRNGYAVEKKYHLEEIGMMLNLTRERIRQIEEKTEMLFRKRARARDLVL